MSKHSLSRSKGDFLISQNVDVALAVTSVSRWGGGFQKLWQLRATRWLSSSYTLPSAFLIHHTEVSGVHHPDITPRPGGDMGDRFSWGICIMISNLGKLGRRGLSESFCNTASSSTHACRPRRQAHGDKPRYCEMAVETRPTVLWKQVGSSVVQFWVGGLQAYAKVSSLWAFACPTRNFRVDYLSCGCEKCFDEEVAGLGFT